MEQFCTQVFVAVAVLGLLAFSGGASACGYESCNEVKPDMLNVHLVPHTHDDVGWLKTVDQYYTGANNSIQHAGVQYILDSVIPQLKADPAKRFIYVELAFFERWWSQQSEEMKTTVKQLVEQGRLEFINGGWCMNDEATTHYNAIIDQMTLGLKFLNQTFGLCGRPRIAWHIDPFGHSREQASIFARMGFDGFYFGRLHYADKTKRLKAKTMEMVWRGSASLGAEADLFTGALYHNYNPPPGFCYDQSCSDPPIQDDPSLYDYNVDERVDTFLKYVEQQATNFTTNNIILTMGSDFQYENANLWYKNLDKLIKYANARQANGSQVHLLYSTPSCYTYAVNQAGLQAGSLWTTKEDDFFPYADKDHSYWTGYFTSRPTIKGYVRLTNNFLQVCKQLEVLGGPYPFLTEGDSGSWSLRRAMGVSQHHDAVSGTEKQHVAYDYAERLARGTAQCQSVVGQSLSSMMTIDPDRPPPQQDFCTLLNISVCDITHAYEQIVVTVYNPLARNISGHYVQIPVKNGTYTVHDKDGHSVDNVVKDVDAETRRIRGDQGDAPSELLFPVAAPALGYNTYVVFYSKSTESETRKRLLHKLDRARNQVWPPKEGKPRWAADATDFSMANEYLNLTFDGASGLLKSMLHLPSKQQLALTQSFYWYNSSAGNSALSNQPSGAYIFRPNSSLPSDLYDPKTSTYSYHQYSFMSEVRQQFTPWASQVIRLYRGQPHAQFQWTVGPIPFKDGLGKEVVSRFDSGLQSGGAFWTDSNGREMIKRVKDQRPTWRYNDTEPAAGNYYPVNSRIFINDGKSQLTVMTDRSQGGSSLKNGSLELMLHRRMFYDDFYGVGEPLNETGRSGDGLIARGTHSVLFAPASQSARLHRDLGEKLYMAPSLSFSLYVSSWRVLYHSMYTGLKRELPPNIHLLSLESWDDDTLLLRLEHQYEVGEDPTMSLPVTLSLKDLFVPFDVASMEELTLGANQLQKSMKRLNWKTQDLRTGSKFRFKSSVDSFDVTLHPMDIKTFRIKVNRRWSPSP